MKFSIPVVLLDETLKFVARKITDGKPPHKTVHGIVIMWAVFFALILYGPLWSFYSSVYSVGTLLPSPWSRWIPSNLPHWTTSPRVWSFIVYLFIMKQKEIDILWSIMRNYQSEIVSCELFKIWCYNKAEYKSADNNKDTNKQKYALDQVRGWCRHHLPTNYLRDHKKGWWCVIFLWGFVPGMCVFMCAEWQYLYFGQISRRTGQTSFVSLFFFFFSLCFYVVLTVCC